MNTRVWKSWFIVELCKKIPLLCLIFLTTLETRGFFELLLTFNVRGQNDKKASFYTSKSIFSLKRPVINVGQNGSASSLNAIVKDISYSGIKNACLL